MVTNRGVGYLLHTDFRGREGVFGGTDLNGFRNDKSTELLNQILLSIKRWEVLSELIDSPIDL